MNKKPVTGWEKIDMVVQCLKQIAIYVVCLEEVNSEARFNLGTDHMTLLLCRKLNAL